MERREEFDEVDDPQMELVLPESEPEAGGEGGGALTPEERRERRRAHLLRAADTGQMNTVQEQVAWILNHYPEARDSDVKLMLKYWETFDSEVFDGDTISREDFFELTKVPTIVRARQTVQNRYDLFQASPAVRAFRKKLSAEERERVASQQVPPPLVTVFADESGKTDDWLVVGSVWVLNPADTLTFTRTMGQWRQAHGITEEFHFARLNPHRLDRYKTFAEEVGLHSASFGFKAVTVPRRGLNADAVLPDLFYHLLVEGLDQEHQSRAPLPRSLQFLKDHQEPISQDLLLLANLTDRLKQAAETRLGGQLRVDRFESVDSKDLDLIQVADLFTGSISRLLNFPDVPGPKDELARYFLPSIGGTADLDTLRTGDPGDRIRLFSL